MTELPRVELQGPYVERGTVFCATCCLLYLGAISDDEAIKADTRTRAEIALAEGRKEFAVRLPHPYKNRIVRKAVTIAGSVYYPVVREVAEGQFVPTGMPPMPVCWVHLQGMRPMVAPTNGHLAAAKEGQTE